MGGVSQYSVMGNVTELPDLITGRYNHACTSFLNSEGVMTLLVTGGQGGPVHYHSSTETFSLGSSNWVASSPSGNLPSPRAYLSAVTIGNSIFVVGGMYYDGSSYHFHDEILDYQADTWTEVGKMRTPRMHCAVMKLENPTDICN